MEEMILNSYLAFFMSCDWNFPCPSQLFVIALFILKLVKLEHLKVIQLHSVHFFLKVDICLFILSKRLTAKYAPILVVCVFCFCLKSNFVYPSLVNQFFYKRSVVFSLCIDILMIAFIAPLDVNERFLLVYRVSAH